MTSPGGSNKPLSSTALRELVSDLGGKIDRLEHEVEQLRLDNSNLRIDNQALKDEIARLKHLPPRPPFKSSGMEKATQPQPIKPGQRPGRGLRCINLGSLMKGGQSRSRPVVDLQAPSLPG